MESVSKIAKCHFTFKDWSTVFCQIEAINELRILTPLSIDPNDCSSHTPDQFLINGIYYPFLTQTLHKKPRIWLKQYEDGLDAKLTVQKLWRRPIEDQNLFWKREVCQGRRHVQHLPTRLWCRTRIDNFLLIPVCTRVPNNKERNVTEKT